MLGDSEGGVLLSQSRGVTWHDWQSRFVRGGAQQWLVTRWGVGFFLQPLGCHEDHDSHHQVDACLVPTTTWPEASLTSSPAMKPRILMMHMCGQRRLYMPQMSIPFGLPFHFQENVRQVYPHMCKVECMRLRPDQLLIDSTLGPLLELMRNWQPLFDGMVEITRCKPRIDGGSLVFTWGEAVWEQNHTEKSKAKKWKEKERWLKPSWEHQDSAVEVKVTHILFSYMN